MLTHERAGWVRNARVTDLSLAGACVELRESIEPGSSVILELLAPTLWDPLVLQGVVAWTRRATGKTPARVGIRFVHRVREPLFALFEVLSVHVYE